MFRPVIRAASANPTTPGIPSTHMRAMASVINSNFALPTPSSHSFPYPASIFIRARVLIVQEAEKLLESLEKRKVPIEEPVLGQVESLRSRVLSLETSLLGDSGKVLKDWTWGMNPAGGLINEEESRENLVAEVRDMRDGLCREVNQIVSLVESKVAKSQVGK